MHYDMFHHPVVVATDGTSAALRGVWYAALEARRLGVRLEIVHVVPGQLPTGPVPIVPNDSLRAFGLALLERSREAARTAVGDVETISTLVSGARVSALVGASSRAQLLVLGSLSRTLAERAWTGATVAGVCARSECPVVVVPHDWAPPDLGEVSQVLVGFKSPRQAAGLLGSAFELASRRNADLTVIHGWRLPSVYDGMVSSRVDAVSWREDQVAMMEGEVARFRHSYPDVRVSIEVVHGRPADILVQATRGADQVLISRPVHGGHFHHLGAVARAVLRESHCPVAVLPSAPVSSEDRAPRREHVGLRA